jgi:hypothetical protein
VGRRPEPEHSGWRSEEHNTTQPSKQAMLTELELLVQQQILNIHSHSGQLLAQLANSWGA